jgi:hypothetical protein
MADTHIKNVDFFVLRIFALSVLRIIAVNNRQFVGSILCSLVTQQTQHCQSCLVILDFLRLSVQK